MYHAICTYIQNTVGLFVVAVITQSCCSNRHFGNSILMGYGSWGKPPLCNFATKNGDWWEGCTNMQLLISTNLYFIVVFDRHLATLAFVESPLICSNTCAVVSIFYIETSKAWIYFNILCFTVFAVIKKDMLTLWIAWQSLK